MVKTAESSLVGANSDKNLVGTRRVVLIAGLVFAGFMLRLVVFLSPPRLLAVGDAAEYVALARELVLNHYAIPPHNTLYYPGTPWIYPPLGLELLALIVGAVGLNGWTPFYALTALMVAFDSLTVIPVYLTAEAVFGGEAALAAGLLFAAYPPDLYALSWSAYPQIVATFITAWVLWLWVGARSDGRVWRQVAMGVLAGLVALVHDLTAFVLFGVLLVYAVLGVLWGSVRRRGLSSLTRAAIVALTICAPFMVYWYAPRFSWVFYAATSPTAATNQTFIADLNQFLNGFTIPIGVYYGYALVYAALLLVFACTLTREFKSSMLPLVAFGLVPLAVMIYKSTDVVLVERLPYYVLLPATIFAAKGVSFASRVMRGLTWRRSGGYSKALGLCLIVVFAAFTAFSALSYSVPAHTYYARCDYCATTQPLLPDLSLYSWILHHTPPGSVFAAAGHLGYYIAAYDGRPTIAYHPLVYLTQPSERYESLAAYTLVFEPAQNTAHTLAYILQFNVSYVVVYDNFNVTVPYFYVPVYSDGLVTVYRVSLGQTGQM